MSPLSQCQRWLGFDKKKCLKFDFKKYFLSWWDWISSNHLHATSWIPFILCDKRKEFTMENQIGIWFNVRCWRQKLFLNTNILKIMGHRVLGQQHMLKFNFSWTLQTQPPFMPKIKGFIFFCVCKRHMSKSSPWWGGWGVTSWCEKEESFLLFGWAKHRNPRVCS